MPRTGKGGKREGASQTSYSNRTDLNDRGPQPITAAPGEPYGQRQMLEDAQRAVPMAGVQTPTPAPTAPQNEPQAPSVPAPGTIPFLHPSERPDEPLTHGLASGPGAGPEILVSVLEAAAQDPASSSRVQMLADFARAHQL